MKRKKILRKSIIFLICACFALTAMAEETTIPGSKGVPDLTRGGELTRINKRWAGPIGIYCGAWRPVQGSSNAHQRKYVRQLLVREVEEGSPADGILKKGDVILGADGTGAATVSLFPRTPWAMIPIADAITEAEARDPALLKLLIWRPVKKEEEAPAVAKPTDFDHLDSLQAAGAGGSNALGDWGAGAKKTDEKQVKGSIQTLTIKLQTLGRYSDTAPYNCEKSRRVLRMGIKALYESNDPGKAYLGVLCLLAADDPTHPDNAGYQARAAAWVYKMMADESTWGGPWFSGPKLIVLSEYYMKTKDQAVFPTLVKEAEHHARGVSWFGTTGHKWCDPQPDGSPGRLSGYGPINCSGALGFLGLSLARKAGVQSPVVDAAIKRQRIFFGQYAFHGGIPYGEMPYGIGGGADDRNGVHALSALALGLQKGQEEKAKYFTRMATLSSYSSRQYAHGGPFFGQVWQPIGAGQGGVKAAHLQFKEIRWHLDLKRRWDGSILYDPTNNKYRGFCYAANTLLFYALPLKQLYITGRGRKESLPFSNAEFDDVLATRNFDAGKATTQQLIAALSRFQGMRRSAAGEELANRIKAAPGTPESAAIVDQLLALAADCAADPIGRAGACRALMNIKHRAPQPVAELKNAEIAKTLVGLLKDPDPYIRFAGVRGLQALDPDAVRPHVNEILAAVISTGRPTFPLDEEDPLQWAHGEMGSLLFGHVLTKSLAGVDRAKLIPAIRSLLETPNASARNVTSRVLPLLTMQDTLELADVIADNVTVPPPGNAMGGSGAPNCQKVLTKHHFEEALPLSVRYDNGNGSGVGMAIKNNIPQQYGQSALAMRSGRELMQSLGDLMLVKGVDTRGAIKQITESPAPGTLNKLKSIHSIKAAAPALTLPAAKTQLVVDATNYGVRGENETTYTWRKVYGPGKVAFTSNATGQSKKTAVEFTDRTPGIYRFEVTMSDTLGLNELTRTVDVTLYDKGGKLPANRPPQATSRELAAIPGVPKSISLSGTDPDGDDLGFVVSRPPVHGRISGVGGKLTYTADYGFNGTDRLTFKAIDGQGETASGTVRIKVSDKDVGVVVYEGFDYPAGAIQDRGGSPSFGFAGPWTNTKGTRDFYLVDRGSLDHPEKNPSLSYPDLPSTGGKLTKGKGWWPLSRPLDVKALSATKLLDNDQELWFSVFVGGTKGRGKFFFGLEDRNAEGGADIGFGFDGPKIFATKDRKPAGTSRVGWSRSMQVMFEENAPNMIIGRCVWGKTDRDSDTLEIYRVFDAPEFGPMVLKKPVCVMQDVVPQETINSVYLVDLAGGVDEIRIGPTLNSVMLGTRPLGGAASADQ